MNGANSSWLVLCFEHWQKEANQPTNQSEANQRTFLAAYEFPVVPAHASSKSFALAGS